MGPPQSSIQDVPVGETVRIAYRTVFGRLDQLAKAALVPFMLSVVLVVPSLQAAQSVVLMLLVTLLQLVPYTLFAVAWHRLVLLGGQAAPPVFFPGWHRRHWRFYGFALAVTMFTNFVLLLIGLVSAPLVPGAGAEPAAPPLSALLAILVALFVALYVMMRFSFVFPAVAVDESYTLADAWRHTRGQGLRLIAATLLAVAPLMIGGALLIGLTVGAISGPVGGGVTPPGNGLSYLLSSALGYLCLALSLTIFSSAFRICTGWIPAASPAAPAHSTPEDADFDEGP